MSSISIYSLTIIALFAVAYGGNDGEVMGVLVPPLVPGINPILGPLLGGNQRAMPNNALDKSPFYYYYRPRNLVGLMPKPRPEPGNLVGWALVTGVLGRSEAPLKVAAVESRGSGTTGQYSTFGAYPESVYGPYGYGYNGYNPNFQNNLPVAYYYGYPYYYGSNLGYGYGLPPYVAGAGTSSVGAGVGGTGLTGGLVI